MRKSIRCVGGEECCVEGVQDVRNFQCFEGRICILLRARNHLLLTHAHALYVVKTAGCDMYRELLALQPCNKVFPLELVATNKAVKLYPGPDLE